MEERNTVGSTTDREWTIGVTTYQTTLAYYEHRMQFEVYRARKVSDGTLLYLDFSHHEDDRANRYHANPWLVGHITWDGCCNFSLEEGGVMAHVCGLLEIHDLSSVFDKLYAAAKQIPNWSE